MITFPKPPDTSFTGGPVTLTATASSNLPVNYSSNSPGICTVSGSSAILIAAGQCSMTANQAGNASYLAAAPITQTFNVLKAPQTISFTQPADTALSSGIVTLSASATSGLVITLSSNTPSICMVSGSTASLLAVGQCSITATQPGNANYAAASSLTRTFNVTLGSRITPAVTWANPADILFGSALGSTQLSATASVPGTFAYTPGIAAVLLPGNGQTLSVLFTPTDSATYTTASASVVINITSNLASGPVVTNALARDPNTSDVVVTFTFANAGTQTLTNLTVTSATIGSTAASSPALPGLVAVTIPAQHIASFVVRFSGSVGVPGTRVILSVHGVYDQGSLGYGGRVTLP